MRKTLCKPGVSSAGFWAVVETLSGRSSALRQPAAIASAPTISQILAKRFIFAIADRQAAVLGVYEDITATSPATAPSGNPGRIDSGPHIRRPCEFCFDRHRK